MATGKEISNLFMAGVNTPRCDEDRLEFMELTVFLLPEVEKVKIGVNDIDLQVNEVTRLQALVDKKKVVVTKGIIRDALRLDDKEGVDCLPNEEIFAELQRVGTLQRVETFDETILDDVSNQGRMIAEMDQDDDVVLEDDKEDKEVVDAVKDVEEAKEDETEPAEVQEVVDVVTTAKLITKVVTAPSETITAAIAAAPSRRRKGVVIRDLEGESTTSTIIPAKTKSKDKGKGILVEEPKPLKKKQQIEQDEQYARELQAELNKDIDWDEAIDHVKRKAKEDPAVKRYQVLKRKPQIEAQVRKNMMMYLKNVASFKMNYLKGMSYDDIRPIFEDKFNLNVAFLHKTKEHIEEDENRAL
nr:hypothetical protein [Tanacetum cinerariifolium]